jgi:FeS assembly protein IscX
VRERLKDVSLLGPECGPAGRYAGEEGSDQVKLTWQDTEEIAIQLADRFHGIDPLTVRFTDLHKWVVGLPDFADDAAKSSEGILEAIQMAWHEEYKSG